MSLFRCGGGSSQKVAVGTFTASTTTITDVVIGFKPKYLSVEFSPSSSVMLAATYNEDVASNKYILAAKGSGTAYIENLPHTGSSSNRLKTINSDGFTMTKMDTSFGMLGRYFAIG